MRNRVERLVQQRLVTGQLVGAEEAEVDHAVLAVAWDVVVEDLPNLGVVWEAEDLEDFEVAQAVEAVVVVVVEEEEEEEEEGSAGVVHRVDLAHIDVAPVFELVENYRVDS